MQVELAHGGRGPPPSSDRRGGYGGSGGGRHGISRHSEYRGATKAVMFYYIHEGSLFIVFAPLILRLLVVLKTILTAHRFWYAVIVRGLPSSASWQDLKVSLVFTCAKNL